MVEKIKEISKPKERKASKAFSKIFLILSGIIVFFFLLASLGVIEVNKKVTNFLQQKAREEVVKLEKELGLKIHWKNLHFKLLDFSINLEDIHLEKRVSKKKFPLPVSLNGVQHVKKIFLRPSLFFLFKKKIFFSKIELQGGRLSLKTAYQKVRKRKRKIYSKALLLPFRKISIKDMNISLKHGPHTIDLSKIKWNVKNNQGVYSFTAAIQNIQMKEEEEPLTFQARGYLSDSQQFSLNECVLKNKNLHIETKKFAGSFNNKGLERFTLESQGQLPYENLKTWLALFGKTVEDYQGYLSYKLSLEKKEGKGFQGQFDIQSKESHLREIPVKEFSLKGHLRRHLLIADRGFLETAWGDLIKINKIELLLNSKDLPTSFSIVTDNISSRLIEHIKRVNELPISSASSIKGNLKCKGRLALFQWECQSQLQTPKLSVNYEETDIATFHDMDWRLTLKHLDKNFEMDIEGTKKESTNLKALLQYTNREKKWLLKLNGYTNSQDTRFPSVDLKGSMTVKNGDFEITEESFKGTAELQSDFLEIENYRISNMQSLFQYDKDKLLFKNIKSRTEKSGYNGFASFDLENNSLTLDINSPFFYTEELLSVFKKRFSWPFQTLGTGSGSFFMKHYFEDSKKNKLLLKGHLFNTVVQKEFFPNIVFDISSSEGKGLVRSLRLEKNKGDIQISGDFDSRFHVQLDIKGSRLALERSQTLASLFPFNQSGILNFNLKAEGPLSNLQTKGDILISETALYTYSVKDSNLKIAIDKKGFTLQGSVMKEIHLKKLRWPFNKNKPIYLKGYFIDWDFVKALMARNRKESTEQNLSKVTGHLELAIEKNKNHRGFVEIENFLIQKNNQKIKNQKSFKLIFDKTHQYLSSVNLLDETGRLLKIQNTGNDNILISGSLPLEPLSFLFPDLQRFKGEAKVRLTTLKNLKVFNLEGWVSIREGGFTLDPLPAIQNITSFITIKNKKMRIKNFHGFSGSGTVKGEGFLIYDFKNPLRIDTRFPFQDITLNIPKGFSTTGKGELQIQGKKPPYALKGNYTIEKGLITKEFSAQEEKDLFLNYSFLKDKTKTKTSPFHMDIEIKTLKPILIKNNFIKASLKGDSHIYGPMDSLLMEGGFNILPDTGQITFRGQEFKINEGKVSFLNNPPDNPSLRVSAWTLFSEKVRDPTLGPGTNRETTIEYNIFLTAKGPAKELDISLESVPHLKEREIISMLTFGASSRHFDEKIKQNITQYSYQLIGSLLLQQPLNREIRDRFGLELDINNHINIDNKPVSKITLKKKWFTSLETSLSRTIEELPQSDLKLKYRLNRNMALTAFWEDKEPKELEDPIDSRNKTGLDLEASFEF